MRNNKIKKLTTLAMFLALATLLNYVESLVPLFVSFPGVKLGLANTVNLVVLYYYGRKEYFSIGILRVLLVGVMFNGLFSNSFLLSLSGFLLSSIMVIAFSFIKKISIYTLSTVSAIFHCLGQILCAMIIIEKGMILYLPIILLSSIISSVFIAIISSLVIKKLNRI